MLEIADSLPWECSFERKRNAVQICHVDLAEAGASEFAVRNRLEGWLVIPFELKVSTVFKFLVPSKVSGFCHSS